MLIHMYFYCIARALSFFLSLSLAVFLFLVFSVGVFFLCVQDCYACLPVRPSGCGWVYIDIDAQSSIL